MKDCNRGIETTYLGDVQIDNLDSIPDFVLAERDVVDPTTGNTIRTIVRVSGAKLFGGGTLDNVTTLEPNNDALSVPEKQVLAAYVSNMGAYTSVLPADATHAPQFLVIGTLANKVLIQNTGVIFMPEHEYLVGSQYYLNTEDGTPTTDSSSGIKLFVPLSTTQLAINLGA